ncbi:hypothetical protein ACFPLB_02020 [Aquamicrobium segne]|uniref:Uncharacterized protein n=1 Tax=Aquamicrobium segne TaxID=469547 RepID=A0ABW0GU40_9HYPH
MIVLLTVTHARRSHDVDRSVVGVGICLNAMHDGGQRFAQIAAAAGNDYLCLAPVATVGHQDGLLDIASGLQEKTFCLAIGA